MSTTKLANALKAVDWANNVGTFLSDNSAAQQLADCSLRLAHWAKQLEIADQSNPSLAFIREMQVSAHHVIAATSLAMYKSAASSMRAVFESSLYYTYFRTHLMELATLGRDRDYFVTKEFLLDYHKHHTLGFLSRQEACNLLGAANGWYKDVSSIIHGQVPGGWSEHRSLSDIKHVPTTLAMVVEKMVKCVEIVHLLFLCTVAQDLWMDFSSDVKRKLLHGLSGPIKNALSLDGA